MDWKSPAFSGAANQSVDILMSGQVTPLGATDSVWVMLQSDGSASGGSSF